MRLLIIGAKKEATKIVTCTERSKTDLISTVVYDVTITKSRSQFSAAAQSNRISLTEKGV